MFAAGAGIGAVKTCARAPWLTRHTRAWAGTLVGWEHRAAGERCMSRPRYLLLHFTRTTKH